MLVQAVGLTWPAAVVCGALAAQFFGFPVELGSAVHAWVPSVVRHRYRLRAHTFMLQPDEIVVSAGGRLTSERRTLLDLLAHLPFTEAHDLLAWAASREAIAADQIAGHLTSHPRRKGAGQLRRLERFARDRVWSHAEQVFRSLLVQAGITGWRANARVRDGDGVIGLVDVLFEEQRVAVEIDGRRAHGAGRFQSDRSRQNRLVAAGYHVLRFTWEDITARPTSTIRRLVATLAAHPGRRPEL